MESDNGGDVGGDRMASFRARLAAGDADALMGPGLREGLRALAAPGLEAEVGAVRAALARLLEEEGDASRLAAGVARLTGVAVQAERLRRGDGGSDEMQEMLRRVLAEIDAEVEERRRREAVTHGVG